MILFNIKRVMSDVIGTDIKTFATLHRHQRNSDVGLRHDDDGGGDNLARG